jgi:2-iminobutanoate/2-iminopropanoate deaminase
MSTPQPSSVSPRPLSSFRVHENTVYVSGQVGVIDGKIPESFEAQMTQTLHNLQGVLTAAGTSKDKVLKCTCFVRNEADATVFNRMYAEFFAPGPFPARSTLIGGPTTLEILVEIEAIAARA